MLVCRCRCRRTLDGLQEVVGRVAAPRRLGGVAERADDRDAVGLCYMSHVTYQMLHVT